MQLRTKNYTGMEGNDSRSHSGLVIFNSSFESKRKISAIYFACISLFIIFGNSITLCITWKKKAKKPTDFLLGTLSALDLLTPLTEFPLLVIYSTFGVWLGGETTCHLVALISLFLWRFSMIVSTMITVDRFLAIAKPFFYRSKIRLRPTRVAVVVFGIYSLIIAVLPLVEMASQDQFEKDWWRCIYHWKSSRYHPLTGVYVVLNSIDTSLSVVIMSVCNFAVVAYFINRNRKQSNNVGPEKNGSYRSRYRNNSRKRKSDMKYAKIMACVSFYSPLCVFPVQILILLHQFGGTSISAQSISLYQLHVVAISLLLNPLSYALIRKHYRRAYWFILRHPLIVCGVTSNGDFDFDAADNSDGLGLDRKILNFRELGMTALATARFRLRMKQVMDQRSENIAQKGNQVATIPTIVKRDYSLEDDLEKGKRCPPCIFMDNSDAERISSATECSETSTTRLRARPNLLRNLSLASSYFSDQESLPPSPGYLAVPDRNSNRSRTESNGSSDTDYSDFPSTSGLGSPKRLSFDNDSVFLGNDN
ncbi:5-hydroxytryptamine receptor 7-like [Actinia tenebrosa]|uniref:5-hydroxytryptamine receptor 7-like n=1 Tax=Actinia tenebrosa TaxID=6105 RepID=A0A6P8J129_ACTTE|nr:5-hydroxytryptamine receptor 7-like [Actinia tenebrosa]